MAENLSINWSPPPFFPSRCISHLSSRIISVFLPIAFSCFFPAYKDLSFDLAALLSFVSLPHTRTLRSPPVLYDTCRDRPRNPQSRQAGAFVVLCVIQPTCHPGGSPDGTGTPSAQPNPIATQRAEKRIILVPSPIALATFLFNYCQHI